MVIGEEKGRGVNEKVMRNFGMPKAEARPNDHIQPSPAGSVVSGSSCGNGGSTTTTPLDMGTNMNENFDKDSSSIPSPDHGSGDSNVPQLYAMVPEYYVRGLKPQQARKRRRLR